MTWKTSGYFANGKGEHICQETDSPLKEFKSILANGLISEVQTGFKGMETQHGTGMYPNISKCGKLYQP